MNLSAEITIARATIHNLVDWQCELAMIEIRQMEHIAMMQLDARFKHEIRAAGQRRRRAMEVKKNDACT